MADVAEGKDAAASGVAISSESRAIGALVGLAAGDALGTAIEFKKPGTFEPLTDMIGGGPFHLQAGQWTDDTSMMLCLAESLLVDRSWEPEGQIKRYTEWCQQGLFSCKLHCFDIGMTVSKALDNYRYNGDPYAGPTGDRTAGNGSLMRLAPVPVLFWQQPALAVQMSALSSLTTHGCDACISACRYYGALIVGAMQGASKEALLAPYFVPEGLPSDFWTSQDLHSTTIAIAEGSFRRSPPDICGSGYVVHSMEAALWAFAGSSSFEEGALNVANLGQDADTTAAIYGQLAGAFYGLEGIPAHWLERVAMLPLLTAYGSELHRQSALVQRDGASNYKLVGFADDDAFQRMQALTRKLFTDGRALFNVMHAGPKELSTVEAVDEAIATFLGDATDSCAAEEGSEEAKLIADFAAEMGRVKERWVRRHSRPAFKLPARKEE